MINPNDTGPYIALLKQVLSMENTTMSEKMTVLRQKLEEMPEGDSQQLTLALSKFIMKVESNIRLMKFTHNTDTLKLMLFEAVPLIPTGNPYGIEFMAIAKQLISDAGYNVSFARVEFKEEVALIINRFPLLHRPLLCDGCNVIPPHEHRCHGMNAIVQEAETGRPCECSVCTEKNAYSLIGVFSTPLVDNMMQILREAHIKL